MPLGFSSANGRTAAVTFRSGKVVDHHFLSFVLRAIQENEQVGHSSRQLQTPSWTVFGVAFWGRNTFAEGIWSIWVMDIIPIIVIASNTKKIIQYYDGDTNGNNTSC